MEFAFWISRKLRLMGHGSKANASGISIAVAGIAIAYIVMAATLGIVRGFKNQISERVLAFEAPISILPAYDTNSGATDDYVNDGARLMAIADSVLPSANATEEFSQPGLLKTPTDFCGVYIKGYGENYDYAFQLRNLAEGHIPHPDSMQIAISNATALAMDLHAGDKVDACFFVNDAVKSRRFKISGIYNTGFSEYDKTIAYAPISALRSIAGVDSTHSTRIIAASAADRIEDNAAVLQEVLIDDYQQGRLSRLYPVDNAKHTGAMYFNWLSLLDTNVVVIFILMTCVTGFTLISSMFILVLDRIPTIGLLRSLGATRAQIRHIFTYMAFKAVVLGLLIGNAIGLPLLWWQEKGRVVPLDPDMYYLPYVPVEINWGWMLILNLCIIAAAWLILAIPSRAAAGVAPASAMRAD